MKASLPYKYITAVKNGKQYVVFDFKSGDGKRKRKWVSTGLPEKCTKKALNEAIEKIVADFEEERAKSKVVLVADDDSDNTMNNQELSAFFSDWLTAVKPNVARTTFQCYKRIMECFLKYMDEHYHGIMLSQMTYIPI
jgi:hypothetical protein